MKSKKSINRAVHIIAGLCAMAWIFAAPVLADFQRTKIAVLDFVMVGEKMEPEGIGTILSEWFITSIVKSGRFDVVERAMLQKIIAEQNLSTTGLVDESTASELGKLLGVDVIITGSILKLKNTMDINARIISVQSGSIIAAENISSDSDRDYHELVKQLTTKIMQNFPLTGYIVKKDKKTATIDLGSMSGLASGTDFVVYKEGEVIKHPKTGEVLDVEQIVTGQIRITKISKNVAIGDILSEEGDGIEYGHLVKSIQQSSDAGTVKTPKPKRNAPAEQTAPAPAPAVAGQSVPASKNIKEQAQKAQPTEEPPPAHVHAAQQDSAPAPALTTQSAPPTRIPKGQAKKVTAPEPPSADVHAAHQDSAPVASTAQSALPPKNSKGQAKKAQPTEAPPPANVHAAQQDSAPAPALTAQTAPPAQALKAQTNQIKTPEPPPANEKAVAHDQSSRDDKKPAAIQPAMQTSPKKHVAVFPSAFNMKADVIEAHANGRVPEIVEEVLEDIDRYKQFQFSNFLKDKRLHGIAWNQSKPNLNGIVDQAKQHGVDFVVLYYFSFWEGQGLVNGWGTDFQNPDFKVFLIDVQNQKILKEEDSRTTAFDQLFIELKGMTRKLFRKTDFHN